MQFYKSISTRSAKQKIKIGQHGNINQSQKLKNYNNAIKMQNKHELKKLLNLKLHRGYKHIENGMFTEAKLYQDIHITLKRH